MNKQEIPKRLNANNLKIIAIIAMTVDHLTWALFTLMIRRNMPEGCYYLPLFHILPIIFVLEYL